jgi:putative transcriptional regulator
VTLRHHLDDATVVAYAAGTLGEGLSIAVATHLAYCSECRAAVRAAEQVGGHLLAEEDAKPVSDACRAATLASLDGVMITKRSATQHAGEVPHVLAKLIDNTPLDKLKWKTKGPGIAVYDLPVSAGSKTKLQLLKVGRGKKLPEHGHGGEELTVILRGSYSDHTGKYQRGDIADLDEEVEHQPVVDSDIDCICLIATEAPAKFRSFWARLAQPFVGV